MLRNRYGGRCCKCKRYVLENQGYLKTPEVEGGRWKIECERCHVPEHPGSSYPNPSYVPRCLATLGLTPPVTRKDVNRAYRSLALKAHPDQGGSERAFIELQRSYEAALQECLS